jgi:hypothetical protein
MNKGLMNYSIESFMQRFRVYIDNGSLKERKEDLLRGGTIACVAIRINWLRAASLKRYVKQIFRRPPATDTDHRPAYRQLPLIDLAFGVCYSKMA